MRSKEHILGLLALFAAIAAVDLVLILYFRLNEAASVVTLASVLVALGLSYREEVLGKEEREQLKGEFAKLTDLIKSLGGGAATAQSVDAILQAEAPSSGHDRVLIETLTRLADVLDRLEVLERTLIFARPQDLDFLLQMADAYVQLDRWPDVVRTFDRIIRLDPKPHYYGAKGNAEFNLGLHKEAVEDYAEAINLDPKDPRFYQNRRLERSRSGNFPNALMDAHYSIQLAPSESRLLCPGLDTDQAWRHHIGVERRGTRGRAGPVGRSGPCPEGRMSSGVGSAPGGRIRVRASLEPWLCGCILPLGTRHHPCPAFLAR